MPIRVEDPSVPVVPLWVLACGSRRGVELDAGSGDGLERSQGVGSGLKSVRWGDDLVCVSMIFSYDNLVGIYIGIGVGIVGVWVWIHQVRNIWVQWPSGNMDLFSERGGVCLQEWIHVLPAVEMADAANLGVHDGDGGVAGSVAKDETLNVRGLDLAAVVDDLARWRDHDLRGVQGGKVKLGVSEGDEDLVGAGSLADAVHLGRVGGEGVLTVLLEKGERLEVVDLPHPVWVTGNPCGSKCGVDGNGF